MDSISYNILQFELDNLGKAIEWSIRNSRKFTAESILTKSFVATVHRKILGEVWFSAGNFRNNSLIGSLEELLERTKLRIRNRTFDQDEIAIRLIHRLLSIQCFSIGNGMHARLMADILVQAISEREAFSWKYRHGSQTDRIQSEYQYAMKQADQGYFRPLVKFARS